MVDKTSLAQRRASATIDSGDDFSNQSTQANDNYDNFDQTIMDLEDSQKEDPLKNQAPQPANHYGRRRRSLAINASLPWPAIKGLKRQAAVPHYFLCKRFELLALVLARLVVVVVIANKLQTTSY